MERMEGIKAARSFVKKYYDDSFAALLFGSVARGDATPSSDLDILIVASDAPKFYRKSFRDYGWVVEAFVGSRKFTEEKIQRPRTNHSPSYLTSWAEGVILRDHNDFARNLKERAILILEQGPEALTVQEINRYRYVLTDWLGNLMDSRSDEEALFVGHALATRTAELLLANNREWVGETKWLYLALQKSADPKAMQLVGALRRFCGTGEKDTLIEAVESILEQVGGKLQEGYEEAD